MTRLTVFLVLAPITLLLLSSQAAADYEYVYGWGEYGTGPGQFDKPGAIAFGSDGTVYIVDKGNGRIQKFTHDGEFIAAWGEKGQGEGQLWDPQGIAVDANDDLYIAEYGARRIQKFTSDGQHLLTINQDSSGGCDSLFVPQFFSLLWGIAIGPDGNLYAAGQQSNNVVVYSPEGEFLRAFGYCCSMSTAHPRYGPLCYRQDPMCPCFDLDGDGPLDMGDGGFDAPSGVCFEPGGTLLVADWSNQRVQRFAMDGTFLGKMDAPSLCLTCDQIGRFYTSGNTPYVWVYDSSGALQQTVGSPGHEPGEQSGAWWTAVDEHLHLFVGDMNIHRIQVFSEVPVRKESTTWGTLKSRYE